MHLCYAVYLLTIYRTAVLKNSVAQNLPLFYGFTPHLLFYSRHQKSWLMFDNRIGFSLDSTIPESPSSHNKETKKKACILRDLNAYETQKRQTKVPYCDQRQGENLS